MTLRQVGYVLPVTGIVVGLLLVVVCLYDAPIADDAHDGTEVAVAAGTKTRVKVATWGLLVFGVFGPVGLTLFELPVWPSVLPIVPLFTFLTWRQSVAEGVPFFTVASRAWRRR